MSSPAPRTPITLLSALFLLFLLVTVWPLPSFLPTGVRLASGQILLGDFAALLLLAASASPLLRRESSALGLGVLTCFVSVAIAAALWGLVSGAPLQYLARDARYLLYLLAAFLGWIACEAEGTAIERLVLRFAAADVLWSGVVSLLSAAGFSSLFQGRFGSAAVWVGDTTVSATNATRVLLDGAYVVMCALPVLFVLQFVRKRPVVPWPWATAIGVAAAVSIFFSYQRAFFVAPIAAICLLMPLVFTRAASFSRLAGFVTVLGAAVGLAVCILVLGGVSLGGDTVASAWLNRVIGGLNPRAVATESSAYWRIVEFDAAVRSIATHPWTGVGLGAPYRDWVSFEPFPGNDGRAFVHNFYLSAAVKFGIPVIASALFGVAAAVFRTTALALRSRDARQSLLSQVALAAFLPLAITTITSPVVFSTAGAPVVATIAGLAVTAWKARPETQPATGGRPQSEMSVAAAANEAMGDTPTSGPLRPLR